MNLFSNFRKISKRKKILFVVLSLVFILGFFFFGIEMNIEHHSQGITYIRTLNMIRGLIGGSLATLIIYAIDKIFVYIFSMNRKKSSIQ